MGSVLPPDAKGSAIQHGHIRVYTKRDENGEDLPSETQQVQLRGTDVVTDNTAHLARMFDVVATKDYSNCNARANIIVDGVDLVADIPVTTLLWLEKQLVDLHSFVAKFPTLDPSKEWNFDDSTNQYRSQPVGSTKSKKVLRNHVKAEATPQHPAQVDTYTEDEIIGDWKTTYFSGAFTQKDKDDMLARVDRLSEAVKIAREEANSIEVQNKRIGRELLDYIFS